MDFGQDLVVFLTLFWGLLRFSYLGRDRKDVMLLNCSKRLSPHSRTSLDSRGMSSLRTLIVWLSLTELSPVFLNVLFINPSSFVYDQMPAVELTV
jgi:hypothetical protein